MNINNTQLYDIYTCLNKDCIIKLCDNINMPSEVTIKICDIIDSFNFEDINKFYPNLFSIDADKAVTEIDSVLNSQKDKGFIWLIIYLCTAIEAKNTYKKIGISKQIYIDTMSAFSRFVREHKQSFGVYGYDRQWWNYRQTSCKLFRIGELEYELYKYTGDNGFINGEQVITKGDNVISIHIPSDARLTDENCKTSFKMVVEFFDKYFSSFEYSTMFCESWIISPNLREVLNKDSKIIKFLNNFEIFKFFPDSEGYKSWIFKNDKLSIDELPQDTSLQRNVIAYLKKGGKIGEAAGIIRKSNI